AWPGAGARLPHRHLYLGLVAPGYQLAAGEPRQLLERRCPDAQKTCSGFRARAVASGDRCDDTARLRQQAA
ncbi:MAG: hypothetical protein NZ554_09655, partial [Bryobacteraceae bacterium]|nr:hypothetical protein [Bryobacteraceae bacterium]